jgi:hypothetical protein
MSWSDSDAKVMAVIVVCCALSILLIGAAYLH